MQIKCELTLQAINQFIPVTRITMLLLHAALPQNCQGSAICRAMIGLVFSFTI